MRIFKSVFYTCVICMPPETSYNGYGLELKNAVDGVYLTTRSLSGLVSKSGMIQEELVGAGRVVDVCIRVVDK